MKTGKYQMVKETCLSTAWVREGRDLKAGCGRILYDRKKISKEQTFIWKLLLILGTHHTGDTLLNKGLF